MKKRLILSLSIVSILAVPLMGLAVTEPECLKTGGQFNPTTGACFTPKITDIAGIITLINTIGNYIFSALMVVAGIFLVVAAFYFVTGGGEPEKLNKARDMLKNALIGVAVALGARGLIVVISNLLGTAG